MDYCSLSDAVFAAFPIVLIVGTVVVVVVAIWKNPS